MSSPSVNTLSAGVQQLYNQGLLPSSLSTTALNHSSASQLNQLASNSISTQETATLLGLNSDSSSLSSTATNSLLQEINPTTTSSSTTTDPLTAAVDSSILAAGTAAADKFLPQSSTTGSQINVLG
jgi:hypothetical protein